MINNRMNRMRPTFFNGGDNNMGNEAIPPMQQSPSNAKALQKRLQKVSFALVEVVLYLDAYPNCERAKKYYKELASEYHTLISTLAKMGVPTSSMSVQGNEWTWIKGPWPWEYEANV